MFIGYVEDVKRYGVYFEDSNTVETSRYVFFCRTSRNIVTVSPVPSKIDTISPLPIILSDAQDHKDQNGLGLVIETG